MHSRCSKMFIKNKINVPWKPLKWVISVPSKCCQLLLTFPFPATIFDFWKSDWRASFPHLRVIFSMDLRLKLNPTSRFLLNITFWYFLYPCLPCYDDLFFIIGLLIAFTWKYISFYNINTSSAIRDFYREREWMQWVI